MFMGSGDLGAWTDSDWAFYYKNRSDLWAGKVDWINPDPVTGWDAFALHASRLAKHYSSDTVNQFVDDFALVFGGIDTTKLHLGALVGSFRGPEVKFLMESNVGLSSQYIDDVDENQSHHYAGYFYAGHYEGYLLTNSGGYLREMYDLGAFPPQYDPKFGDYHLGQVALLHGWMMGQNGYQDPSLITFWILNLR